MSSLTCLTCNVAFTDVDVGRLHYKTDWHRYNLKRKVANLEPITFEHFTERQHLQAKEVQKTSAAHETSFCKPCNKSFSTSNAYENHIQSKKHKEVVSGNTKQKGKKQKKGAKLNQHPTAPTNVKSEEGDVDEAMSADEDDSDVESWDSYDENTIGIEECLFCSLLSTSLEDNVAHMTAQHGFFLPDAEFLKDLEGLITYLGEKVGAGHVCLWCNEKGKRFHNTKDVQRHMLDKGHCKLLYEGDSMLEYSDFYDYSTSYPDGDDPEVSLDEVVNPMDLETDGFTLTLPSGATVGHRSLVRYYQQNLVPYLRDPNKRVLPKMLAHYKALGWTGSTGTQVQQRAKDLKYMQRIRQHYRTQLGIKGNNMRHRFRDPNGLC